MIGPKRYVRSNSIITISVFYEQYRLNKYNFNPEYQRESNLWKEKDKEFLIDTIFKNFPMPPIFCEQKIDKRGITLYDVIDGKQRLNAIIDFIENRIHLPKDFSSDDYGHEALNGKKMDEIVDLVHGDSTSADESEIAKEYLDTFWAYKINMEYIEKPDEKIVRGIFDRLNRNGLQLNSAELRNAQYYDSVIFKSIKEVSNSEKANAIFPKDKRQMNVNFWAEVFIFTYKEKICSGNAKSIDVIIKDFTKKHDEEIAALKKKVFDIIDLYSSWNIDLNKYNIAKEVHIYNLLYLALCVLSNKICIENVVQKLNMFFQQLRNEGINSENKNILNYYNTTQSGSKSLKQREKRFIALKEYLLEGKQA